MAAAEEEARQKALKALREKQDMLIAIKERKAEGQLLKYYANEKYKVAVAERDPDGYLPIHWAAEAQCKQNVFFRPAVLSSLMITRHGRAKRE